MSEARDEVFVAKAVAVQAGFAELVHACRRTGHLIGRVAVRDDDAVRGKTVECATSKPLTP